MLDNEMDEYINIKINAIAKEFMRWQKHENDGCKLFKLRAALQNSNSLCVFKNNAKTILNSLILDLQYTYNDHDKDSQE